MAGGSKEAVDLLRQSRDLLQGRGRWMQGDFFSYNNKNEPVKFCAIGAICHVGHVDPDDNSTWTRRVWRAVKALAECTPPSEAYDKADDVVVEFNDKNGTKKKDVLSLFDCAIGEKDCT